MKKTREIKVWVNKDRLHEIDIPIITDKRKDLMDTWSPSMIEARLIIEEPERTVTISESELRECFDSFMRLDDDHGRRLVYSFLEHSKDRFFNKDSK